MPLFNYTSIDTRGKEVEGTIDAADIDAATASLKAQGKLVTSLKEGRPETRRGPSPPSALDYLSFVRSKDIIILFRQLATLFAAGLTLVDGLSVLEKQSRKRGLQRMLGQIRRDVEGGMAFSWALQKHPRVFRPIEVGMVEAGEASGTLDVMLSTIADDLEARATLRTETISSFIYPSVVVLTSIGVIVFLVGYVLPNFMPIIKMMGEEVPWNTQLLIDATEWFKNHGSHLCGGVGLSILLFYCLYKFIGPARYWVDRLKLKLPVFGPIFLYSVVIRFSRNLSSLLGSGLSILESLERVRHTVGNRVANNVIRVMERRITRGESLSAPLKSATHLFPPMVADMVAVGEETGKMDTTLELVASIHEKMLKTYIKRMSAMIEPALILAIGSIVGFVAWSFISGVLSMYGRVGR